MRRGVAAAVAASVVAADVLSFHFLFRLVFYSFMLHMYTRQTSYVHQKKKVLHATSASCGRPSHVSSNYTIYMSSYYYVFVRMLLSLVRVRILLYIHICPHTTNEVSSYCYLFTCPLPLSSSPLRSHPPPVLFEQGAGTRVMRLQGRAEAQARARGRRERNAGDAAARLEG